MLRRRLVALCFALLPLFAAVYAAPPLASAVIETIDRLTSVGEAQALTPGERALLFPNKTIRPTYQCDYLAGDLCGGELFSRAGNATMFDSTGKLTYAPNNWLLYSNTFTNAAWLNTTMTITNVNAVADPFGGTNATTLAAAGATSVIQQFTARDAATGLNTLWMRRRTGTGQISLIKPDGSNNYVTLTGTWQQVTSTSAQGGTYFYFGVQINTAGDAIDVYYGTSSKVTYETSPRTADQVITTASAYYGPRIDYDPATLSARGLLIEESRTNYALYSTNISGSSLSSFGGSTAGGVADLSGGTTGVTYTASATNAVHFTTRLGASLTAGQTYTQTFYLKQGSTAYTLFGEGNDTPYIWGTIKWSDLSVSTNGQAGATVSTPVYMGGGIYGVSLTYTRVTSSQVMLVVGPSNVSAATIGNASGSFAATGTETAICVAWQTEQGTFPTSLIPTGASAVTRAADVVQLTGPSLAALQGEQGAAVLETGGIALAGQRSRLLSTTSDAPLSIITTSLPATVDTYNNATQVLTSGSSVNFTTTARYGVAWSAAGRSISANGGPVGKDANVMHGGSTAQAWLGSNKGSSAWASGWYRSLAVYNQRLPNATLQAKSIVGASYAANDNLFPRYAANDNLPIIWRRAM